MGPTEWRGVRQKVWRASQAFASAASDGLAEMFGVPVDDDRGEEVQPGHPGVDSGRGQDDTLRLPRPSFSPCLSPVVAIVVAMSAAHPFRGCEDGKI